MFTSISFRNSGFIMFLGHSSKWNRQTCTRKPLIFLIKISKILRVFVQDVPYRMKAYILWKCRLVNDLSVCQQLKLKLLSMQINIYCLMTNQTPVLLVQSAPWTQTAVTLLQSLYFSRPPPPRAIIPDARPHGTFENQDGVINGKTRYISTISRKNRGLWTV